MKTSRLVFPALLVLAALLIGLPTLLNVIRGPAPTPDVFSDAYTLEQASALSQETGKPMLVLVTADWCAPCQKLKRSTMTDPRVVGWARANTIPVFLEDGANKEEIRTLPVRTFPTTLLINGTRVLASLEGAVGAGEYLNALSASLPETAQ